MGRFPRAIMSTIDQHRGTMKTIIMHVVIKIATAFNNNSLSMSHQHRKCIYVVNMGMCDQNGIQWGEYIRHVDACVKHDFH
jgi:carbamoylphosphate synthase large subunit